jgi:protein TonB
MITNLNNIKNKFYTLVSSDNNRVFIIITAIVVTFVIFLIIQSLISRSANIDKKDKNPNLVEFIRIKEDNNLQERTRQIPDKPPQPEKTATT